MKSIKLFAVLMLLTVCSSFAISERVHPYIGAKGGFSFVGGGVERYRYYYDESKYYNSSDITYLGSGSLGLKYRFLRIEFEYQYIGAKRNRNIDIFQMLNIKYSPILEMHFMIIMCINTALYI